MNEGKAIPIILLVSERSGSNLLRTLVGNHSKISAPVAPHLMTEFFIMRGAYGDLRLESNADLLIQDMLSLANHPYHDWKLSLNSKEEADGVKSIVQSFDLLYRRKAISENKFHYASKGIGSFEFIDQLKAELPHAKFIHMVRDPRDYVASWMKKPIHLLTPFDAIKHWVKEQDQFLDALWTRNLNCISIRYEDLISDTEGTITRVFNYLELPIENACFSTNPKNEESHRNPHWENLSKPIISNNSKKFSEVLSDEDTLIIETIAKNQMQKFGYALVTSGDWSPETDFYNTLEKKRALMRQVIEASEPTKAKEQLNNKLELIAQIREARGFASPWLKQQSSTKPITDGKSNYNRIIQLITARLKYLMMALLGNKLTAIILKGKS